MRPSPSFPRRRFAPLLLGAAAVLLAGCDSMPLTPDSPRDKAKDEAAKVEYYESAALTYYDGGKYETSVQMWDRVLALQPGNQKAKWGLAKALQMQGTLASLGRARNILAGEPKTPGIVDLDWNHPELGDRKFEVQATLATVYADLADYYDRDVRLGQATLAKMAEATPADIALAKQKIAEMTAKRDELLRKSVPLWRAVLQASPDNPYAVAGLAKAHLTVGNDDLGIRFARQYVEISRRSQELWQKKLKDWEKTAGRDVTDEQRGFFVEKVLGAREKEMKMHLLLATVHMRREEFDLAVGEYDAVIALDPAVPAAYLERAQALAAGRRYPAAVADLEQYLKITDPEKQRSARASAAELLDRYRRIAGMTPLFGAGGGLPAKPASSEGLGAPPTGR
jgi:tetratricopeptide (TPR) repeat protein